MSSSGPHLYLIDTDVLAHIRYRPDSAHIYAEIGKLGKRGIAKTVYQVIDEVQRFPEVVKAMEKHEVSLKVTNAIQLSAATGDKMELVGKHADFLWEQTGGKNPDPADPWLVAVAAAHGYTVVTDENPRSPHRIPAACRVPEIGARCISGPHFLVETGIVPEMKPEHIDPDRFFGINAYGR